MFVSGSYFPVLGMQPALGRLLGPADDRTIGEAPVAVLSHAWWQSRFGADPNVLNDTIIVNGQSLTIVGVAPRDFTGTTLGATPQVFVPITLRGILQPGFKAFDERRNYWVYTFARLKPGVSLDQAKTAINVPYRQIVNDVEAPLQKGMSDQTMARFKAKSIGVEDGWRGQSSVHDEARTPLLLLLGVTALVLLIACANIANLLLARAAGRANEMAIRLSLGASRLQLISQLLVESCLLAVLGGAAGMLVARWTIDLISSMLPDEAAATMPSSIDTTVLLFAAGLTLGTGVLFGLFPALHSTRPDLVSTLKGQAGQPSGAKSAAALPHDPGHGADRALDDAPRLRRTLHQEPAQHQPRRPRHQRRPRRHVRHLAGAQRLQVRAVATVVRAARRRAGRGPGRHRRHDRARAAPRRQQLGQRRPGRGLRVGTRRRQQRALQRGRRRLLPHDGRAAPRRPRVHARRCPRRAEGRDRQRGVREEVQSRTERGRQAHGQRAPGRGDGHRDRRPRAERQVQRGQARDPAALLPPVPAGRRGSDR